MKKWKRSLLVVCFVFLVIQVSGCGASGHGHEVLFLEDGNGNAIYFGMTRSDAKEILGVGEIFIGEMYEYNRGIRILYRGDTAVLVQASQPGWKTFADAEIGVTTKVQLQEHEIFNQYANSLAQSHIYDLFFDESFTPQTATEDGTWAYVLSFQFIRNNAGDYVVDTILFADQTAAMMLQ